MAMRTTGVFITNGAGSYTCPTGYSARVIISAVSGWILDGATNNTWSTITITINGCIMTVHVYSPSTTTMSDEWGGVPNGFLQPIYLSAGQTISAGFGSQAGTCFHLSIIEETV